MMMTVVAACGGNEMKATISVADGQANASKYTKDAAAETFPPGFSLEEKPSQSMPCTDVSDKTTGQIRADASFLVNGIDSAQNNSYFDKLKSWWASHGWTPVTDSRPGDMFINAARDGYLMSLQASMQGKLFIGTNTPCLWRNGTPDQTS
ncbi:hypothetical protein [Amycolatopsis sp. NPDC059021]|uniref:hypothetical protein n=1 Tax=Amycolatopsis sp. NPDC059021 TaxID=3346704 RepID=UPI00366BECB1